MAPVANVANKLIDQFICIVSKQDLERKKYKKLNLIIIHTTEVLINKNLTESLSLRRLCCLVYL